MKIDSKSFAIVIATLGVSIHVKTLGKIIDGAYINCRQPQVKSSKFSGTFGQIGGPSM